jgi:hypothetical protein
MTLMRAFAFLVGLIFATAAFADGATATRVWVQQLETAGYDEIEVGRTWLWRIRIEAERGEVQRLIILDRSTGEVLRDVSWDEEGGFRHPFEDEDDEDD